MEACPSGEAGCRAVLEALRGLSDPPAIPSAAERDGVALAECLFDRFEDFTPGRFLTLLGQLRLEALHTKAEGVLERQYLFLDAAEVARQSLVRLLTDHLAGRRVRPYAAWEDRAVEEVAEACRRDPGLAPMDFGGEGEFEGRVMSELTRFYNGLGRAYRRLVWMS